MKHARIVFSLVFIFFLSFGAETSIVQAKGIILPLQSIEFVSPDYQKNVFKPNVILIPEAAGWLVSLYAPYFDLLKDEEQLPNIISVSTGKDKYKFEIDRLTRKGVVESLVRDSLIKKIGFTSENRFTYTSFKKYPSQSALQLLKRYTTRSPDIIVTTFDNIENFIQASLLAAHFQIPLLPIDDVLDENSLAWGLKESKVKRVFLVSNEVPKILKSLPDDMVIQISPDQSTKMYIEKIGTAKVKNVLLTSIADRYIIDYTTADDAVFFIPFISYLRQAPVIFSSTSSGDTADLSLASFLTKYRLQPRNITILGDNFRVFEIDPGEELQETIYDQDIGLEPGTFYDMKHAVPYGIGRIPFNSIRQMSSYYARLTANDHYYREKSRDFVMISNLIADEGPHLKFAEVISRVTVKELQNFNVKGKSFYAVDPKNKKIWEATLKSGLIIYEGHSNHFMAFNIEDITSTVFSEPDHFQNFPLLILQSCNSHDDLAYLIRRGPIAIVGSSTRVHSASGSSFIKAYLDNTLYQPATLGEALRDAKNYFLSVVALKENRGHEEQAKTNRVALSFRIWGDPEIKLFPKPLPGPEKQPLKLQIKDSNTLELNTPDKFYKRIENEKFSLRSFPMSKQAGIVKRSKDPSKNVRRIESFYFFKLPYEQLSQQSLNTFSEKAGLGDVRNVILEDPFKRWIYMLHYPKKEIRNNLLKIKLNK